MSSRSWVIFCLAVVGYFYFKQPSIDSVAKNMSVSIEDGEMRIGKITYFADWDATTAYTGKLRYFDRGSLKDARFVTHEAILTTGEFSDPEKVFVSEINQGNMFWRSEGTKKPDGNLIVLHLVPASLAIFRALDTLAHGQSVTLTGREETDSLIEDKDGLVAGLRHSNHKFFLVEGVSTEKDS